VPGALVALRRGLRFIGGDVNPAALAHTAARLSAHLHPGLLTSQG
jgi:hypothetical protein